MRFDRGPRVVPILPAAGPPGIDEDFSELLHRNVIFGRRTEIPSGAPVRRRLGEHRLEELSRVGMDEMRFLKGHRYITALNDLDLDRVLEVIEGRTEEEKLALLGKDPRDEPRDRQSRDPENLESVVHH